MSKILDFKAAVLEKEAAIGRLVAELEQFRREIPALAKEALFLKDPPIPEEEWHERMHVLATKLKKYGVRDPDGEWINVEVRS